MCHSRIVCVCACVFWTCQNMYLCDCTLCLQDFIATWYQFHGLQMVPAWTLWRHTFQQATPFLVFPCSDFFFNFGLRVQILQLDVYMLSIFGFHLDSVLSPWCTVTCVFHYSCAQNYHHLFSLTVSLTARLNIMHAQSFESYFCRNLWIRCRVMVLKGVVWPDGLWAGTGEFCAPS